jgi:peptidoglycan/xylan/chitin deacetylase (PgdA/CDA1 family)
MKLALVICVALGAGCRGDDYLSYTWDDRVDLCSEAVDDITQNLDFGRIDKQFSQAEDRGWVSLIHAHSPDHTIQTATVEKILEAADAHHLQYFTFDQLTPDGPGGPGVAFAFDDDDIDGWLTLRDMFMSHGARITFFVTRWYEKSQTDLANIATLAADGHDIEAHSHDHVDATEYVHDHSLDDYINDQVLPSIQDEIDAGYHPTTFAFPFGSTIPAITAAVLQYIPRVRTTPGPCPY